MRLFVAVALPESVRARLGALVDELRPRAKVRWSHAEDLHVTTKFIGDQPDANVPAIVQALDALPGRAAFRLAVRGVGWFPNARAPRVFWAGIDDEAALVALAAEMERALVPAGVPVEDRRYSPHLTLARTPHGVPLAALREAIAALPSVDFGAFDVDRFALYETRPAPGRGRYHEVASFPFSR